MSPQEVLADIVLILAAAALVALLLRRIGVPPIIGLILAGAITGPGGLAVVPDGAHVELLAEVGVALLLLDVGHAFVVTIQLLTGSFRDGAGRLVTYPGQRLAPAVTRAPDAPHPSADPQYGNYVNQDMKRTTP